MPPKTRLDPIVKLRERAEEKTQLALAHAQELVQVIDQKIEAIKARIAAEKVASGHAYDFEMADAAIAAMRKKIEVLKVERVKAVEAVEVARQAYLVAHKATEVVRRVSDRKRDEMVREAYLEEGKQLDGLATIMHTHKKTDD